MGIDHLMEVSRNIILESFGGAVGSYGMNETIGRIYGLLYMEDEPMSLKKIADQLGVSKATVSINIRLLLELKMVQKVWQKGSRKDYYTAERDFEKITQEIIRNKEMKLAALIKDAISRAREGYQDIIDSTDDQEIIDKARSGIDKLEKLTYWINKGESWMKFFLEANIEEGPSADIQEIEVEWSDQ
ncbi:MAG: GbsR/MarR family transcriptional regulator [Halanaerobiales bacterium]